MSVELDAPEGLHLIAYEVFTKHGFALPCFGRLVGANTVYAARPSRPGDPAASIAGFDVHEAEDLKRLPPDKQTLEIRVGDPWHDVFLWGDHVYVGTKAEIWRSISDVRRAVAATAPLSLLNLAEGVPGMASAPFARAAFAWLRTRRGDNAAVDWQIDTYLRSLAIRGLRRHLGSASHGEHVHHSLRNVRLVSQGNTLRLNLPPTLPDVSRITAATLYDCARASHGFGLRLVVMRGGASGEGGAEAPTAVGTTLVMRLRQGRGKTQTQIPFAVTDSFFRDEIGVRHARTGRFRAMTLSRSEGRRNTMKLQVPEIAGMSEPVARFERGPDGITYEIYDAVTTKGSSIKKLLDAGLRNGTTHETEGGATLWRIL